jgi:Transposase, Mutator family
MPRGGRPHVFTELLPREEAWHETCEHCERHVERREGPKAPRHYQFVARGIAEALHAVGAGSSYRRASWITRDRAHRFRFDAETGELRESDHGQLVADWVELFAPVVSRPIAQPHGRRGARCCSITCPSASGPWMPLGAESRRAESPWTSSARSATWPKRPRLWRAEAFPTAHPASWSAFLGSLPGEPKRVVCDAHGGMLQAISECWPQAELHQCEWHLQHALERLLAREARRSPSAELDELRVRAEGALTGPSFLQPFVRAARAVGNESVDRWIAVNGPTIQAHFAHRPAPSRRPADMPFNTSALEQITRPVVTALYPRRYGLQNRARLNRLLMLLQLHVNGDDDVQTYARTIRAWLEANGGRPTARRRAIADPADSPSLR